MEIASTRFKVQTDDEYLDNAAYLRSSLRYCADSSKMCVSVKVVWTKLVPGQYFILFILLLLLFIAAIHYPCDSQNPGVHWYVGKRVVKCRGMF